MHIINHNFRTNGSSWLNPYQCFLHLSAIVLPETVETLLLYKLKKISCCGDSWPVIFHKIYEGDEMMNYEIEF